MKSFERVALTKSTVAVFISSFAKTDADCAAALYDFTK